MADIKVVASTQRVIVNPSTSAVNIVNAGPVGPPGAPGEGAVDLPAVLAYLRGGAIAAGANMALDLTNPAVVKLTNTMVVHGETDYINAALDDPTDIVSLSVSDTFKNRVLSLEQSRALIQTRDSIASGGPNNYMLFPGTTGNYISTPSATAYNTTNSTSWVVRVQMPASAPASTITLIARRGSSNATTQFAIQILNTGQFQCVFSTDGTTTTITATTAATPLAFDGNYIWLRVNRSSTTGQCNFFTAPDTGSNSIIPTVWTSFQANRGTTAAAMYTGSAAPVSIGSYNAGASALFTGRIGRALFYDNVASTGTPLLDANASDYTTGTTWTDPQTRVWTITGTASVVLVGGAVANTSTEFVLCESDSFPGILLSMRDTLMWNAEASLINTSAGAVNFTPKLRIGGVDLFTMPAISVPTAAGSVYNFAAAIRIASNNVGCTSQIARAEVVAASAATGTDLGSSVMSVPLAHYYGNRAASILTMTSIPAIQLTMTHATAATTVSSRPLRTQLFLAKA